MRRLTVFNNVTLDGFIADMNGDMSWAHKSDAEWNTFIVENTINGGMLLFGRITYERMASFWPTAHAHQAFPEVAEGMNRAAKVVFSKTMAEAAWRNTRLVKGDLAAEVRKLKQEAGADMVILGSGSIVSQLTEEGLIDEYHLVVNPVALGKGKAMFESIRKKLSLKLATSWVFGNGNVLLCYQRAG